MTVSVRKDLERLSALLNTARDALKEAAGKLETLRAQVRRLGEEPEC